MNLRDFCQESGYHSFIGLTYTFDPLFFERIILRDLWQSGVKRIMVLGDHSMTTSSIVNHHDQIFYLGKEYFLFSRQQAGAFHPKILIKIGPNKAKIVCSSGNMTYTGWGGNREIVATLDINANESSQIDIINSLLNDISHYLPNAKAIEFFQQIREQPWLRNESNKNETTHVLITPQHRSLSSILADRWVNRQFHTMYVYTGSIDQHGAFLRWCHQQFGIKQFYIAFDESHFCLKHSALADLPIEVNIAFQEDEKSLHAKSYFFEGPNEKALIMGSANCTGRAWIKSPQENGNVENILIYDTLEGTSSPSIFQDFPSESIPLKDTTPITLSEDSDNKIHTKYQVQEFNFYKSLNQIDLILTPQLPGESSVEIEIGDSICSMTLDERLESNRWLCNVPEKFDYSKTIVAKIILSLQGEPSTQLPYWITDHQRFEQKAYQDTVTQRVNKIVRSATRSSTLDDQILADLAEIQQVIFSSSDEFQDPFPRNQRQHQKKEQLSHDHTAEPIKAESLFRSITEIYKSATAGQAGNSRKYAPLSIRGVFRLIFLDEREEDVDTSILEDEGKEKTSPTPESNKNEKPEDKEKTEDEDQKEEDRAKKNLQYLEKRMTEFLEKFRSEEFQNNCTVEQFKQAAAYPLGVSYRATRNGWLPSETAETWVLQSIITSFIARDRNEVNVGLIEKVRSRYKKDHNVETFTQCLHDGLLWVATLKTIDELKWEDQYSAIKKQLAIRAVLERQAIIQGVASEQAKRLFHKRDSKEDSLPDDSLFSNMNILRQLEEKLENQYDRLIEEQIGETCKVDDLVWSPNAGWGEIQEDCSLRKGKNVSVYLYMRGYVCNIRLAEYFISIARALNANKEVKQLVESLGG